ncbi:MAG: NfeD family protein [Fimbriiglobus sp.]
MEWYLLLAGVLVLIGILALFLEFFLPTGGILVVVAVGLLASAVGVVFYGGSLLEGIIATVGLCIGLPVAGSVMFSGWKRLALKSSLDADNTLTTLADVPEIAQLNEYVGMVGKTLSPMRPAGIVELAGRRVDAVSQGPMLEPGETIKCVEVRAGTVVVRKLEVTSVLTDL